VASVVAAPAPGAPAAQLAPALIQIAHASGGHQITVRLAPAELGQVDIHIDRGADGTASVRVLVERPETLKLLQGDQATLNQTLDKAGLPSEGRSLSLSLSDTAGGGSAAFTGGQNDGHNGGQNGSQTGGQMGGQTSGQSGGTARPGGFAAAAPATNPAAPNWRRAGIDITA
jgi:flagellar hook-length control protein FliK